MNTILSKIIDRKKEEVRLLSQRYSARSFESMELFTRPTFSLSQRLRDASLPCIISEFKRASPSLGAINKNADLRKVITGYQAAGASAVSILTDEEGFSGTVLDVTCARENLSIPILRKEFIIDSIQILESKAIGADVILLIAACLSPHQVYELAACAKGIGLEVLLEVHSVEELSSLNEHVDVLGVNNRDLHSFEVSFEPSFKIAEHIRGTLPLVSESGLKTKEDILMLFNHGFNGFLVGESFMKTDAPENACKFLISELERSLSL